MCLSAPNCSLQWNSQSCMFSVCLSAPQIRCVSWLRSPLLSLWSSNKYDSTAAPDKTLSVLRLGVVFAAQLQCISSEYHLSLNFIFSYTLTQIRMGRSARTSWVTCLKTCGTNEYVDLSLDNMGAGEGDSPSMSGPYICRNILYLVTLFTKISSWHIKTISNPVCGDKTKYFKTKHNILKILDMGEKTLLPDNSGAPRYLFLGVASWGGGSLKFLVWNTKTRSL